jgi:sterol desaturase/sphingolipid hydroxylase (fatty acid hydroxylase superfamily)
MNAAVTGLATDTYLRTLGETLRDYLIFCGAAFLLFHLLLRRPLAARKITQKPIEARAPLLEVGRTVISNLFGKGPLIAALALLAHEGLIPAKLIYKHVDDHGWAYLAFTVVFDVLFFDLWFYLSHRFWLHSRFGYRRFHIVHHRSVDPTPFARNSVHPVEGIGNALFHLLPVFLLPHHPLAILIATQLKGLIGIVSHLGYEVLWSGFSRHWLGRYLVTPVHHHLHHSKNVRTNFSFFINYDLIFGTQSPDYHAVFEETVGRGKRLAAAAADAGGRAAVGGATSKAAAGEVAS